MFIVSNIYKHYISGQYVYNLHKSKILSSRIKCNYVHPSGVTMTTDIVAQLAYSLAKTGVGERELSYKGQGRKLDDAHSGENYFCLLMFLLFSFL